MPKPLRSAAPAIVGLIAVLGTAAGATLASRPAGAALAGGAVRADTSAAAASTGGTQATSTSRSSQGSSSSTTSSSSTSTGTLPCSTPLSAGGGEWRSYGHDPFNTRTQPAETTIGTAQAGSLAPAWVFALSSVGDSGQLNSTPLVENGCAFFTASNGGVYAVNAAGGAFVWKHDFTVSTPGLGGAIVGGLAISEGRVYVIVNETGDGVSVGPYVAALNMHTGSLVWQSRPINDGSGYYSNATPQVIDDVVFAGFSPAEGDSSGQGGFALVDTEDGRIVKVTDTISAADQKQGFAGGGIWSTPAWNPQSGFAYVGAGNPYSKTQEDPHTNAILKIDMRDDDSPTFGSIVAAYKGNVDQYTQTLQALSQTPLCAATVSAPDPLDDPACGQLDLDFGASPNLFTANGHLVVGDLQKAGVYHVADAGSMAPVWNTVVGATCQACNAASTAVDGSTVLGESTPGGLLFGLGRNDGARTWETPVGDGAHYQAISEADGVVYTVDTTGFFDAFDAATGLPIMRRQMSQDTSFPMGALTSGGIAVAYHTVYVAGSGGPGNGLPEAGFLVAYRLP